MIDSPKVATYDKLPKMSVQGVADKVAEVVRANQHEFVMCNFAPPDMVRPLLFVFLSFMGCINSSSFYKFIFLNSRYSVFG
jgi:phosphopentomutase/2,3-bisphosphoglycerate-independent phosphoglycerate mutase family metalloenzyme